jgi:hypothetical protein
MKFSRYFLLVTLMLTACTTLPPRFSFVETPDANVPPFMDEMIDRIEQFSGPEFKPYPLSQPVSLPVIDDESANKGLVEFLASYTRGYGLPSSTKWRSAGIRRSYYYWVGYDGRGNFYYVLVKKGSKYFAVEPWGPKFT